MTRRLDILLLAGSAEARALALALRKMGHQLRVLMAEPPRGAEPFPVSYDIFDFNDLPGLSQVMSEVSIVVDASHGFDLFASAQACTAARRAAVPYVRLRRAPWSVQGDPGLRNASDVRAAAAMIRPGQRVFSATGWASLPDYAPFAGARLFLRQTRRHDRPAPAPHVTLVFGDPPFTAAQEAALFQELGIDLLICRNLGSAPSRPKVDAALALGIEVILVDPPAPPVGALVLGDVASVLDWVAAQ
jgi:precorrin-6A/cobalt-precorrin-6A reductase